MAVSKVRPEGPGLELESWVDQIYQGCWGFLILLNHSQLPCRFTQIVLNAPADGKCMLNPSTNTNMNYAYKVRLRKI